MENAKNWILHLVSNDDNKASSAGNTFSISVGGQEDQSEIKTVSLSSLLDELDSNKPTLTNQNLGQAKAELNLKTATTMEIKESQSNSKRSKFLMVTCTKELGHYVALQLLARGDDLFQWWKKTQETLSLLSKLASKYISALPSSVESEKLFSTGGNVHEPMRNRLCPKYRETLRFLHYNLKIFNFKY